MLWPDSVVLAGQVLPLADVLAAVTIHHGRAGVTDDPVASTCQVTILDVDKAFVQAFDVGASLEVTVRDGAGPSSPRFTGTVTDGGLAGDELTIIATARLSTLGRYQIGLETEGIWPAEPWSARVTRIFANAGLASLLELEPDPLFDPELAARDPASAGPTTVGDYLTFLAPMVGAAVTDRLDGRILVQPLGARTLEAALALDPAAVAYVPSWEQVLPAGNIVTVRYTGDQSESVVVRDDASVALYGPRARTIDTSFVSSADALERANSALARGAYSHWNMPEAPILHGLELTIGQPVTLSAMPESAPFDPWTPIVEGWTDELSGSDWTMLLALSDPLASGLIVPWNVVPPAWTWATIDQQTAWADALTLDSIAPGG